MKRGRAKAAPRAKPAAARPLDGRALAKALLDALPARVAALADQRGEAPRLAILAIGSDSPSEAYLKSKLQSCRAAGIETSVHSLPRTTTESEALVVLDDLAKNAQVDGIIIEVPLPEQLDARRLTARIPPEKDVEGVTERNFGRLFAARKMADLESGGVFVPCTAAAVLRLLETTGIDPRGKEAVVVGRSNIVGKPVAQLLTCLDATVTLCHTRTKDLAAHVRRADILVCAAGKPGLIKGRMLKRGCVVLDAGTTYEGNVVKGDVDAASASRVAGWLTPVPGGIGPVTTAALLANTVLAAERRTRERLAA
ncbi:MAG: bifunctional 5,10-methylenetetrahydrofolate dehydrogenase/5,10-methenyltetrahydrofolate cyclohydrolase [Elusimicrobia bacterium]|nr:bifunctional 5,10-methylenetetrahydrofolate dehydrogenase/5,10-methenyltetrahydrofolate cyclohydrolase [Elusimicrobiota bacterium]